MVHYAFYTDGTASPDQPSAAGAVILIAHTLSGPRFGGFRTIIVNEHPTSARAEACAALLACWWATQLAAEHPYHVASFDASFTYDSFFAGKVAAGQWTAKKHLDVLKPTRALVLWLQAIPSTATDWHYVPSHSGHPYNEAADSACWAAMCGWIPSIDSEPLINMLTFDQCQPHLAEWLWFLEATLQGQPGLPRFGHFEFVADVQSPFAQDPDGTLHPFNVQTQTEQLPAILAPTHCTLRCATANVLTLFHDNQRAGAYISGRQEALMAECHDAGLMRGVGIQESRSRLEGHVLTTHYHVLAAPVTTRGVGGTQLWVARQWPTDHGTVTISSTDIRILHSSSQRIAVKIASAAVRLVAIVLHAPSGQDPHALDAWWIATSNAIPSSLRSWDWIVLADANSRVGSITSDAIGPAGAQDENEAGSSFHAWLLQHGLLLPQTFEEHHPSDVHDTWVHGTGAEARLDYVAVSMNLRRSQMRTTIGEIDLALHRTDHRMVSLTLPAQTSLLHAPQEISQPRPTWSQNVHSHAGELQAWIASTLPDRPRRRTFKTHLTEDTWTLISVKKFHYNRLRQVRHATRIGLLRALFQAWRDPQQAHATVAPWLRLCDRQLAIHSAQYSLARRRVTSAVRHDDASFYANLAAQHGGVEADEGITGLWRSLKPLLPRQQAKRRSNIRCRGPGHAELAQHYCGLEGGIVTTYPQLLQDCHARQASASSESPLTISLQELPSRQDMELVFQRCKNGKAPGLDRIPIEHLRTMLAQHGHLFYELYIKAWILAAEPTQFKGGFIVSIAKKSGILQAPAMRGIMLLDTLGKVYHALVRKSLMKWAGPRRHTSQFGGYQGQQCAFASLMLRSYWNRLSAHKISNAILFVDVKSAFHCLLRQQLFSGGPMPEPLAHLLRSEGFDPNALNDFAVQHSSVFTEHAPPSLARILNDAHQGTWLCLPGVGGCHETLRGSRPGSILADLAFNWLMTLLLTELQQDLWALPEVIAASSILGLRPPLVTWVDDLAVPIPCVTATGLEPLLHQVLRCTRSIFQRFGLTLNFNPGKTELIVQFRGAQAAACRRACFIDDHRQLQLPDRQSVRLVSQ